MTQPWASPRWAVDSYLVHARGNHTRDGLCRFPLPRPSATLMGFVKARLSRFRCQRCQADRFTGLIFACPGRDLRVCGRVPRCADRPVLLLPYTRHTRANGDGGEGTNDRPLYTVGTPFHGTKSLRQRGGHNFSRPPKLHILNASHQYNGNSGGFLGRSYLFLSPPYKTAVLRSRDRTATIVAHLPRDDEVRLRGRGHRGLRGSSIPRLQPFDREGKGTPIDRLPGQGTVARASRDFLASSKSGKAKREAYACMANSATRTHTHSHTPTQTLSHHQDDEDIDELTGWQMAAGI